jgi:hypothetical protein
MPRKVERGRSRELQGPLPFDVGQADDVSASSAAPAADQCVGPVAASSVSAPADQLVEPGPHADAEAVLLLALSDAELDARIASLEACPDRRDEHRRRLWAARVHRGERRNAASPRGARSDQAVLVPPVVKSEGAAGPRRLRFRTVLGRVHKGCGPAAVSALVQRLVEDMAAPGSAGAFRRIACGLRDGLLGSDVVARAYVLAKRPGIRRPGAFLKQYIWERSPWSAQPCARRR